MYPVNKPPPTPRKSKESTIPHERYIIKHLFLKLASTYFDSDDNNQETLKGSLKDLVGIERANFGLGCMRANRCAILQ